MPLTASTYRLVDGRALAALRPGAFVVNAARGSVVDEEAVADALEAGRLGGYGADVFAFEDWRCPHPPRSIPPRLLAHPRTVLTPHLGSAVDSIRRRMGIAAAQQVSQVLAGRQPEGAINRVGNSRPMSDQRGRQ